MTECVIKSKNFSLIATRCQVDDVLKEPTTSTTFEPTAEEPGALPAVLQPSDSTPNPSVTVTPSEPKTVMETTGKFENVESVKVVYTTVDDQTVEEKPLVTSEVSK